MVIVVHVFSGRRLCHDNQQLCRDKMVVVRRRQNREELSCL